MSLTFRRVVVPGDSARVVTFLSSNEWPFHGRPSLSSERAAAITVASADTESYWIVDDDTAIGLVRMFDLDDLEDGSPLFDIRIGEAYRGKGVGTLAVRWLTTHLFESYPVLHRIEATTRHDNVAMQTVLRRCGYRLEGEFAEAWRNDDGTRSNTSVFGTLRAEWSGST